MGLSPGTRLGPYEIVEPLGAGGMGVVYRARDPRLGREVAIKVVMPASSADPAARERFQREAHAIAALTHPHICAIHDVGSDHGRDYLVLEYIQGESLAQRLQRGPLSTHETLIIGQQIATAVGHAHRAGIVHRDLKPGNVMLTSSGAKVLDFGLARILAGEGSSAAATRSIDTASGVLMGTLPYMAPEQIEGRVVDARADVFAFGAMLYEMLSGKRAFDAPSSASLMAVILRDDPPPIRTILPTVPASLERVMTICLAKKPEDRFTTANDVALALRWVSDDGGAPSSVMAPASSLTRRALIGSGLAALGAAAGFAAGAFRKRAAPATRMIVDLPYPAGCRTGPGLALSPNGRWLAVSFNPGQVLWIYDLHTGEQFRPSRVQTNCFYPCWSPDGTEIAYLAGPIDRPETKAWRVRVPDGIPTPVCDIALSGAKAAAWLTDDTLVLASSTSGLFKAPTSGGSPAPFVALRDDEQALKFPVAAGSHILFLVQRPGKPAQLEQCANDGSGRAPVPVATAYSGVADRGKLFYVRQGVVVGQPYDIAGARFGGEAERVALDAIVGGMNVGHLQVAAGGGHVAVNNQRRGTRALVWRDRGGRIVGDVPGAWPQEMIALSPDGNQIAVSRSVPEHPFYQLFLIDARTGVERRLMTSRYGDELPLWNPDGTRILFRSFRGFVGNGNIYTIGVSGSSEPVPIAEGPLSMYPVGWTREGHVVWATDSGPTPQDSGLYITQPGAAGLGRRLYAGTRITVARLCPSGTRIAFASLESGRSEVYLDSFPEPGRQPVRVSRNGGTHPRWRADGRELYFVDGERLNAVALAAAPSLTVGPQEPLFAATLKYSGPYDPSPDGRRFLIVEDRTADTFSIKLTMNF